MLARALAQDTPVILLDEPTSFLDIPRESPARVRNNVDLPDPLRPMSAHRLPAGILADAPASSRLSGACDMVRSFGGHSGSHLGSIVQQILLRMIRFSNLTISHAPDKRLLAG